MQANDLDRALATVEEKLAHKPNDPLLLYVRADILAQKGAGPGHARIQDRCVVGAESGRAQAVARRRARCARQALSAIRADTGRDRPVQARRWPATRTIRRRCIA